MLAEAEAEQVARARPERDEVALVRVAVLEAQVVQCFRADAGDTERRDVGGERPRVLAGIGVGGAELGHVAVAERVLGGALGVGRGERAVVEEDRPRAHGEPALARGGDDLGQHAAPPRSRAAAAARARRAGPGGKKTAPLSRNRTLRTGLCGKTSRPSW